MIIRVEGHSSVTIINIRLFHSLLLGISKFWLDYWTYQFEFSFLTLLLSNKFVKFGEDILNICACLFLRSYVVKPILHWIKLSLFVSACQCNIQLPYGFLEVLKRKLARSFVSQDTRKSMLTPPNCQNTRIEAWQGSLISLFLSMSSIFQCTDIASGVTMRYCMGKLKKRYFHSNLSRIWWLCATLGINDVQMSTVSQARWMDSLWSIFAANFEWKLLFLHLSISLHLSFAIVLQ